MMQLTKQSGLEIEMANGILPATAKVVTRTPQYRLPEADRQAILAQADSAKTSSEIERQRSAFCKNNFGCAFGQKVKEIS